MNCVAQIAMNLVDRDMSMQEATSAPRLDRSTAVLLVSPRFGSETIEDLRVRGHNLKVKDERQLLGDYSSPASVQRTSDGEFAGGVDPYYYPATASGVD
jgi:gamma-glutamyltranspeptidase